MWKSSLRIVLLAFAAWLSAAPALAEDDVVRLADSMHRTSDYFSERHLDQMMGAPVAHDCRTAEIQLRIELYNEAVRYFRVPADTANTAMQRLQTATSRVDVSSCAPALQTGAIVAWELGYVVFSFEPKTMGEQYLWGDQWHQLVALVDHMREPYIPLWTSTFLPRPTAVKATLTGRRRKP